MAVRHLPRLCMWSLCSIVVVLSLVHRGEARPNYKKAFDTYYSEFKNGKNNKTNCTVCHSSGTDDKKHRNHYGEALAKELGEKMVKDQGKIIEALKAIEDGECPSGKWKLRLEHGHAPCICGRRDHEADSYIARQLHRADNP